MRRRGAAPVVSLVENRPQRRAPVVPSQLLLSADPTGRFLRSQDGAAFQIRGDSPWSIIVVLTREEIVQYLDDRQARGFNTILVEVIESGSFGGRTTAYGDDPFGGTDFTTYTTAYWQHVDFLVTEAAKRGFVVLMCPLYLGSGGGSEGWYAAAVAAGTPAIQAYGAFLGARYTSADNIIWVNGGDYRPPTLAIPDALATGILSQDTRHLFTTHWARNSTGTDGSPSWLTLNSTYPQQATISSQLATDYSNHLGNLPTFMIEGHYEGSYSGQPTLTAQDAMREAWQSDLSNPAGCMYGHHTIWPLDTGWQAAMASNGAAYISKLNAFMASKKWWLLVPDASSALVTAGRGTIGTTTYVTAALASDGSFAAIHIPTGASVTVDLTQMAGSGAVTARYLDPTTGVYTPVSGSPFAQASRAFVASSDVGNNASGGADQILVLEV